MKFITSPSSNQIIEFTELHSELSVPAKTEENHRELIRRQISVLIEDTCFTLLKNNNQTQVKESTVHHLLKEKKKKKELNKIITSHLTESKMAMQN